MSASRRPLPGWVEVGLLPLANIAMAFFLVGLIVAIIGVDPFHALKLLVLGAVGSSESIGYTLYYATNFIFTGLAVAVAFHAGLFNIGGEGQAYIRFGKAETRIDLDRASAAIMAALDDIFKLALKEADHG